MLRKRGRNINAERHRKTRQDRIRPLLVVAVAVIEGDADEPPRKIALDHAPVHFVQRDDVDPCGLEPLQDRSQILRRHFEEAVGLEFADAGRAHVVQHEHRADPLHQRLQRRIGAGAVQRLESEPDQRRPHVTPHAQLYPDGNACDIRPNFQLSCFRWVNRRVFFHGLGVLPPRPAAAWRHRTAYRIPGRAVVQAVFSNNSRPISMRRISLVPAPIS